MKNYKESLKATPQPIMLSQMKNRVDLKALLAYANSVNKKVSELTEYEKNKFIIVK